MKNIKLLALLSLLLACNHSSLKSAVQGDPKEFGDSKTFQETLQAYKDTLSKLKPEEMRVTGTTWSQIGNTITTTYHQAFKGETDKHFPSYKGLLSNLESLIYLQAFGDGFVIGSLGAMVNKLLGRPAVDAKAAKVITLVCLLSVICRNQTMDQVKYINIYNLAWYNNLFSQISLRTFYKVLLAMVGSGSGYLGTNYVLTKLKDNLIK